MLRLPIAIAFMLAVMLAASAHAQQKPTVDLRSLERRAIDGDMQSQFDLGRAYDEGKIVQRNGIEALRWFRLAAQHGDDRYQLWLGMVLSREGLNAEAREWFSRSAEQGNWAAGTNLGRLLAQGLGGAVDKEGAATVYEKAADDGGASAARNLVQMLVSGELGPQSDERLCYWAGRSVKQLGPRYADADESLRRWLADAESRLSAEQVAICRDKVAAFKVADSTAGRRAK
ncbi:tetratricopeptide repeat protein [Roseateles chitinivorans]|uniref:tetratricopeptide repeat protein n=1 Tax=Roseateles chitinivorans TaxID=2917965 RepID=UPI003D66E445